MFCTSCGLSLIKHTADLFFHYQRPIPPLDAIHGKQAKADAAFNEIGPDGTAFADDPHRGEFHAAVMLQEDVFDLTFDMEFQFLRDFMQGAMEHGPAGSLVRAQGLPVLLDKAIKVDKKRRRKYAKPEAGRG